MSGREFNQGGECRTGQANSSECNNDESPSRHALRERLSEAKAFTDGALRQIEQGDP